jgi:hypothetical protein
MLLIRQLNTVRMPHPFPRLLRKWVEKQSHRFLAGSIARLSPVGFPGAHFIANAT